MIDNRIRQTGLVIAALVAIVGWSGAASAAELAVPSGGTAGAAIPAVAEQKKPAATPQAAPRRAAPVRAAASVAPRSQPARIVSRSPVRQYASLERPRASGAGFMALGIGY